MDYIILSNSITQLFVEFYGYLLVHVVVVVLLAQPGPCKLNAPTKQNWWICKMYLVILKKKQLQLFHHIQ